jgi:NitT/TauT family transport system substrate-binding protein
LRYIPSVKLAEESLYSASREMKVAKMLSPETDTDALAKRAFMHLEGVTDDWIQGLDVEKVAGGQVSPNEEIRLLAALIGKNVEDSCCRRQMFDQPDQEAPNLADPDAPCLSRTVIADEKAR